MNIAGIVAEYNPFHLGHRLHIEKTREALGRETVIVCVMSGDFTQRGDFAAFEKHARAEAAVRCGADLVVELPVPWALSSAESFAFGAVSVMHALGNITHISFGSEIGETGPLEKMADFLLSTGADELIRSELRLGLSYAAARQKAALKALGREACILESPNNILGVEYIKALGRLGSGIKPLTFRRIGAGHDSAELLETASASKIRSMLKRGEDAFAYIPPEAAAVLSEEIKRGRAPVFIENCECAILSRLRRMSRSDFALFDGGEEGLSDRLFKYALKEPSLESVLMNTKTKRYALSRIRRLVLRAYLGIPDDFPQSPPYAKILAFGERGRRVIKTASKQFPLITKPSSGKRLDGEARRLFELESACKDLYVLAYPDPSERRGGQEYTLGPRIV